MTKSLMIDHMFFILQNYARLQISGPQLSVIYNIHNH